MNQDATQTVNIKILSKSYGVACSPDEEPLLQESARLLNEQMKEIHKSGKLGDTERIAVMAALNIAHDLVKAKAELQYNQKVTEQHLNRINDKIEQALSNARKTEA